MENREYKNGWINGAACVIAVLLKIDGTAHTPTVEAFNACLSNWDNIKSNIDQEDRKLIESFGNEFNINRLTNKK